MVRNYNYGFAWRTFSEPFRFVFEDRTPHKVLLLRSYKKRGHCTHVRQSNQGKKGFEYGPRMPDLAHRLISLSLGLGGFALLIRHKKSSLSILPTAGPLLGLAFELPCRGPELTLSVLAGSKRAGT